MSNKPLTREQVLAIVEDANARGEVPDLSDMDLSGVNLRGVNLSGANLSGTSLIRADLQNSILSGADLQNADLLDANMRQTKLIGANMRRMYLSGADLRHANLTHADLTHADLRYTSLTGVREIISISGLPSGHAVCWPTPDGWRVSVGCWIGTVDDLEVLVAEDDWPIADAEQRVLRRPGLVAWIAVCRAHIAAHPGVVPALVEKWGAGDE